MRQNAKNPADARDRLAPTIAMAQRVVVLQQGKIVQDVMPEMGV